MDASAFTPDMPLPDDVPTLHALLRQVLAELARLRAENAELRGKLDAALKHRFGRRSERQARPKPSKDEAARRCRPHGRSPLPDHLERREVLHDLAEAEKPCPCCGELRVCIGEQAAEQLDLEPARFFVLRTVRKSYACRHCDPAVVPPEQRIQTAASTQVGPIAKGLCGAGLLAHTVTAKFADHVPLHRLAGQLARSGVKVARSTLGDWLAGAAGLLTPLYQLMHRRLLLSRVIHGDDTGVKLTGAAIACGLAAVHGLPRRGLDGAEDATGDDGMRTAPATGGTAALASAARPSSAARTRKTISVGLTRSMRTVPPSWGRSVARPVAAS